MQRHQHSHVSVFFGWVQAVRSAIGPHPGASAKSMINMISLAAAINPKYFTLSVFPHSTNVEHLRMRRLKKLRISSSFHSYIRFTRCPRRVPVIEPCLVPMALIPALLWLWLAQQFMNIVCNATLPSKNLQLIIRSNDLGPRD
ncbi:hypothetical protein BJ165DRAFT_1481960 [Panaeolus papilionaceus]|nr:hypothetical protein BJ165DRAFT_1481960 [Panaeolus papilionaceus]